MSHFTKARSVHNKFVEHFRELEQESIEREECLFQHIRLLSELINLQNQKDIEVIFSHRGIGMEWDKDDFDEFSFHLIDWDIRVNGTLYIISSEADYDDYGNYWRRLYFNRVAEDDEKHPVFIKGKLNQEFLNG